MIKNHTPNVICRGTDTLTNLQTYTQIFSQYSGISSHSFCHYKTNGTLLQELQPKYDTSWMGCWTGKILTSRHSKFHFGMYCLFLHLSWRKISRYFVLEKFVCFHLWEEYDLMCASVEEIFQDIPFWKILSVFICEKSMIWCTACCWMKCFDWWCKLQIEFDQLFEHEIYLTKFNCSTI